MMGTLRASLLFALALVFSHGASTRIKTELAQILLAECGLKALDGLFAILS